MAYAVATKHSLLLFLPALLALAACGGDATEPEPPPPFKLSLTGQRTGVEQTARGLECTYTLTARATGGETGTYAAWLNGEGEYRDIASGRRRGGWQLNFTDMIDWWGSDRVVTGTSVEAYRVAWMPDSTPFQADHTFRYQLSSTDEIRSAFWRLTCE